jgi:hypothetical protein
VSKKLSLVVVVLVLAAVAATVADVPRDVVVPVAAAVGVVLAVWAYGRSFVAWIAAGTHYGA